MKNVIIIICLMLNCLLVKSQETATQKVYTEVETMPILGARCAAKENESLRKSCSDWVLRDYLRAPDYYIDDQGGYKQGVVQVSFVVNETGKITQAKVVKSVDAILDSVALKLVESLPNFVPGETKGKKVAVKMTVPVIFEAYDEYFYDMEMTEMEEVVEQEVFTAVEDMPVFMPGVCAQLTTEVEQNECTREELIKYITTVEYPQLAAANDIEGKVFVEFIIGIDGAITDAKVVRGVDVVLDEAALKHINNMPNWQPGKQRGKAVRVKYILPVNFELGTDASPSDASPNNNKKGKLKKKYR